MVKIMPMQFGGADKTHMHAQGICSIDRRGKEKIFTRYHKWFNLLLSEIIVDFLCCIAGYVV
jgi:hypothetical protein